MTREQFTALPAALALGLLWDVAKLDQRLGEVEAPRIPFSPKYDMKIFRKEGFQWASETDVESLRYWRDKYAASAAGDGEYALKDQKKVDNIDRWIKWRECFPFGAWSGERDRTRVTAALPSSKPDIHSSKRDRAESPGEASDAHDNDVPII